MKDLTPLQNFVHAYVTLRTLVIRVFFICNIQCVMSFGDTVILKK